MGSLAILSGPTLQNGPFCQYQSKSYWCTCLYRLKSKKAIRIVKDGDNFLQAEENERADLPDSVSKMMLYPFGAFS